MIQFEGKSLLKHDEYDRDYTVTNRNPASGRSCQLLLSTPRPPWSNHNFSQSLNCMSKSEHLNRAWWELTCPPCSSVSGSHGPRWQLQDLEASVHSAARSLTAQWSETQNNVKLCYNYKKKKKKRKVVNEVLVFVSYFSSFGECFPDLAVASTVAGGDEVSDAAALQEGRGWDGAARAEEFSKGNHLHQAQADYSRLGVVPETQTITEPCSNCYDVLRSRKEEPN